MNTNQCKPLPAASLLWEMFSYNPITGILYRIKSPNNRVPDNSPCLYQTSSGHYTTALSKQYYKVHRLVYKWVTGKDPSGLVEHSNDIPTDNRFWNLIDSTERNNRIREKSFKGGVKGYVKLHNDTYQARIKINARSYCLGTFKSPDEAHQIYLEALKKVKADPNWRPYELDP